jgi:tRNA(fMet)-specific endonuclease VapC
LNYLLDSNACIALINDNPVQVRHHFEETVNSGAIVFVSEIASFELWYGAEKSERSGTNRTRVQKFLSGPISILHFTDEDAKVAGAIRATLETAGRPIGAYDLLIAAQALRHKLTLVTSKVREFPRVKSLAWKDWARS